MKDYLWKFSLYTLVYLCSNAKFTLLIDLCLVLNSCLYGGKGGMSFNWHQLLVLIKIYKIDLRDQKWDNNLYLLSKFWFGYKYTVVMGGIPGFIICPTDRTNVFLRYMNCTGFFDYHKPLLFDEDRVVNNDRFAIKVVIFGEINSING